MGYPNKIKEDIIMAKTKKATAVAEAEETVAVVTTKLEKLRKDMRDTATAYAAAYNRRESKRNLKPLREAANAALQEYNLELAAETFRRWDKEGEPVKTAIRERYVPHAQKCSFKTNDDDVMTVVFSDTDYKVNLPMLCKIVGIEKFASPNWFEKVERLAWLLAGSLNKELGDNPMFDYEISEATKAFNFPEEINPHSDEGTLAALQQVFDSILFIPDEKGDNIIQVKSKTLDNNHVSAKEWASIKNSMTYKGKRPGEVVIGNTGLMTELVADAMHVISTLGDFKLCTADK